MSFLSRNKVYQRNAPTKDAKKIYIFCEGERNEINYFSYFIEISSKIDIIPIPCEKGQSDPEKLKKLPMRKKEEGTLEIDTKLEDQVWFVIDTDRWNEKDKINILKQYVYDQNQVLNTTIYFVAQSNPSFEIWQYFHFYSEKPEINKVKKCNNFKEFASAKIIGGFDNRKHPVEIETACSNAETNFESENDQPALFSTELFRLAKEILKFAKPILDQHFIKTEK